MTKEKGAAPQHGCQMLKIHARRKQMTRDKSFAVSRVKSHRRRDAKNGAIGILNMKRLWLKILCVIDEPVRPALHQVVGSMWVER